MRSSALLCGCCALRQPAIDRGYQLALRLSDFGAHVGAKPDTSDVRWGD